MSAAERMEAVTRVGVTVTFLRMDLAPFAPPPAMPPGTSVARVNAPTVAFYRYLYDTVGADYVWWLRRTMPDPELAELLGHPRVSIHILYQGGAPAGFYELDGRLGPDINLSYFGLLPHAIGTGLGARFLRHAVQEVWNTAPRGMTVNTCTADHPRALPTYIKTGFRPMRAVKEVWNVPNRLGLRIPDAVRV